jgi:hypothetical protein
MQHIIYMGTIKVTAYGVADLHSVIRIQVLIQQLTECGSYEKYGSFFSLKREKKMPAVLCGHLILPPASDVPKVSMPLTHPCTLKILEINNEPSVSVRFFENMQLTINEC